MKKTGLQINNRTTPGMTPAGFSMDWEPLRQALAGLYRQVDQRASELGALHGGRLHCRPGCSLCCVDGLTVFEVEAENIRRRHQELLTKGAPHTAGACAMLSATGGCRIYPQRPYVCRTQGLPLRWIGQLSDGSPAEMRDICPLNEAGQPIETLPQAACWSIGPCEETLAGLQTALDGGKLRRLALRSLFYRR